LSIGSSILYPPVSFSLEFFNDNIIECALSAPDGSSPRGYSRIFSGIDSNTDPFTDFCRIPFHSLLANYYIRYSLSIHICLVSLAATS
jgi:hypothetical protein